MGYRIFHALQPHLLIRTQMLVTGTSLKVCSDQWLDLIHLQVWWIDRRDHAMLTALVIDEHRRWLLLLLLLLLLPLSQQQVYRQRDLLTNNTAVRVRQREAR